MALSGPMTWFINLVGGGVEEAPAGPAARTPRSPSEIRRLSRAASRGNATAQRELGEAYLSGLGVPENSAEAARWLNLSAAQGENTARLLLAMMHLRGQGHGASEELFGTTKGEPDPAEAVRLALAAAEAGDVAAMSLLAWLAATGQGMEADPALAARWYGKAAEMGQPQAKLGLGLMRLHATDGIEDKELACRLIAEASEAGLPTAQYVHGTLYEAAVPPLPFDEAKAFELYRRAADAGLRPACARYGLALIKGWGTPANPVEGERWLRRAALAGDAEAAALVGDMQMNPADGSPANPIEALNWYRIAAENGHAVAMRVLGLMYHRGTGTAPSPQDAMHWLDRAAERGDAEAAASLIRIAAGFGPESAEVRGAADRLEALAARGDVQSAFNYAVCLRNGIGRTADPAAALPWMRRVAEAGRADGQFWLGRMLLETGGDAAEAWQLIAAAAGQGHEEARQALAQRA
ncbi:SEL1-like repeat protein [Sabulicella rubraurantiaca]|uniref:SEL1-like repeat protein n=1 Tax=Sabulicella rubraurantiaca TaxID=2811429 RepID=UPI001A97659C|nr:tetratricopeptide repeat protein [Sabulicella rubraurantiaca]